MLCELWLFGLKTIFRGATTVEKCRGPGLGPNTEALAPMPRARPQAGLGMGAAGGRSLLL